MEGESSCSREEEEERVIERGKVTQRCEGSS